MTSETTNDEIEDRQHLNPDGMTDAEKGANIGGVGGALTGAAAGSLSGPVGMLAGAVIGGVAGALASGAAVAAIDKIDHDSATDHAQEAPQEAWVDRLPNNRRIDANDLPADRPLDARYYEGYDTTVDSTSSVQTSGHAIDDEPINRAS